MGSSWFQIHRWFPWKFDFSLKLHVECGFWNRVSEKAPAHRVYPGLVAVNDGDLLQDALAQVRLPLAAQALPPAVTTVRQAATTDNSNTSLPLPATQPPARKRGVRFRRKVFYLVPSQKNEESKNRWAIRNFLLYPSSSSWAYIGRLL